MKGGWAMLVLSLSPRRRSRALLVAILGLLLIFFAFMAVPEVAAASTATSAPTLIFPWQQVWPLVIGAVVPLFTYVLNHVGPWVSEPIKAMILVVVSAAATALYTALATNVIGFNAATLQLILTGVAASLAGHHWLWKPAGIAGMLGAGSNRQRVRAAPPPAAAGPAAPGVAPKA